MCGLFGYMSSHQQAREIFTPQQAENALSYILPRGPDEQRIEWLDRCVLGHTRLAIIDLDPRSAQPFHGNDGSWLVFNGEIYNYLELRKELVDEGDIFETESDTEVLLTGLQRYGKQFLNKLAGMFAFAWYDARSNRLLMARDRLGVKPLIFTQDVDGVGFASDLRSLVALRPELAQEDSEAMALYFLLGYIPAPKTQYEKLVKLLPGHYVELCPDRPLDSVIEAYWTPAMSSATAYGTRSADDAFEEYVELLDASLRLRMRADVPVGLLLSGGIDSATLAVMSAQQGESISAYTMGFSEPCYDESSTAKAVAERYSLPFHSTVIDESSLAMIVEEVAGAYDEPFADTSAIPFSLLCKFVSRQVKVALVGDGGDELHLGYPWQAALQRYGLTTPMPYIFRNTIRKFISPGSRAYYPVSIWASRGRRERYIFIKTGRSSAELASYRFHDVNLAEAMHGYLNELDSRVGECDSDVEWFCRADLSCYLPNDLLVKSDRGSMAYGLEIREPLLDHSLIEFMLSLPANLRYSARGESKLLARRLLSERNMMDILRRKKQGFVPPVESWLGGGLAGVESRSRLHYNASPGFSYNKSGKQRSLPWDAVLSSLGDRFSQYRWRMVQHYR